MLLKEITAVYHSGVLAPLPQLEAQYADFAYWQRMWLQGEALDHLLEWWRARLEGAAELELPLDRRRPATRSARGASCSIRFGPELTQALKSYAGKTGNTDFIVLLAAFAATLSRFAGQTDVSLGTPVSGRIHPAVEPLLGCFVNTLVLRCMLEGDSSFTETLARIRETTLAAWDHQELPFEKLVEELQPARAMQSTPLFQVMFVMQNAPRPEIEAAGPHFQQVAFETGMAKFDLTMILHELPGSGGESGFHARLEYRTDIFDRSTMEQLLGSFRCLLASAAQSPERPLSALALLEPAQQAELLAQCRTGAARSFAGTVHGSFTERAWQTPNAIALEAAGSSLTYAALERRANQLAHHLRALGAAQDALVAVCLERSAEMIVALLAILKTGAAYLPLDPAEPAPRLAFVVGETGVSIAVTNAEFAPRMDAAGMSRLVLLDRDATTIEQQPETVHETPVSADNLAYVMYTSGSTGEPKGVAVPHRSILRLVDGSFAVMNAGETFLQLAPVGFDASTFEIWGALLNGARLVIFPTGAPSLGEIGAFLREHDISTLWLTAGLFRLMVEEQIDSLRGLRQLLAGGDVLPVAQVRRVIEEIPGCRLINGYGPTENTTFTCCHAVRATDLEAPSIPIGAPIAHTEVFILDEHMQLAPPGARGELYTGGEGLARGYYGRPELTSAAFVPHPFSAVPGARLYKTGDQARRRADGTIEFIGRRDGQIKIRGFRVETGEIAAVLSSHPEVREAAVLARDDAHGNRMIAAYIAPAMNPAGGCQAVLDWMRQRLPSYMLPAALVSMDRLPLTANGKIDRNALAAMALEPSGPGEEYAAPRTPDEEMLAKIWKELFVLEQVGRNANFFELGGHSLLATQLGSRIEREFGLTVPLRVIFENATIADLAEAIEALRWMAGQQRGLGTA